MAALGNFTWLGDSTGRGNAGAVPPWDSPAQTLQTLLATGGHSATFVGLYNADPGSIPVCANGGWKIATAVTNLTSILALDLDTVVEALGINDIGDALATIAEDWTELMDDLVTGMGGLGGGKQVYACIPWCPWFAGDTTYAALKAAKIAWVAVDPANRFLLDFSDAGMDDEDDFLSTDGTHWPTSGATKIATYVDSQIDASFPGETGLGAVDVAVLDMQGTVDAFPVGLNSDAGWSKGGTVNMGKAPNGQAAPTWWSGGQTGSAKLDTTWTRFQGWWYVNVTSGSKRSNNGRIQVRKVTQAIQRLDTDAWVVLGTTDDPDAEYYPQDGSGAPTGDVGFRTGDSGGGKSFKFDSNPGNKNIHGYGINSDISAYMGNIKNVWVSIEARLVLDDPEGVDDLDDMKLLCIAGGDYYPSPSSSTGSLGVTFMPGMGAGRFKWLTREWQEFNFYPDSKARDEGGTWGAGVDNASVLSRDAKTVTEAAFRAEPPPFTLDAGGTPVSASLDLPASANSGSIVRARVTDQNGSAVSGATLSWVGNNGGTIHGTTNAAGVAAIRLGGPGVYTLRGTSGALTVEAAITSQSGAGTVNRSQYPEDITNAVWETEGSGNTKTGNNVADIYGTTLFDTFTQGTGTPALNQEYSGFGTASGRATVSRFLKKGSHDWVSLRLYFGQPTDNKYATTWFNLGTGAIGSSQIVGAVQNAIGTIEDWGGGRYRCSVSAEGASADGTMQSQMRIDASDFGFTFDNGASVGIGADQAQTGPLTAYEPSTTAAAVAPTVQAKSLAPAVFGAAYEETVTCVGTQPITWSIDSGSLPAGITANTGQTSNELTLSATDVTATTNGTFVIKALNAQGNDTESFTINVVALAAPDAPVLTVKDSDTLTVAVDGIDSAATLVNIWLKQMTPTEGAYELAAIIAPGQLPYEITGLIPDTEYKAKATVATTLAESEESAESAAAKTYKLIVYAYVEPDAAGDDNVTVEVGTAVPSGHILPGESLAVVNGRSFDVGLVTVSGTPYARMALLLDGQPASVKLRNGQTASIVMRKELGGGQYKWSPVLTGEVEEGP